ncbi:tryptophan--tRNA ligase, mitochondrial isoform X3 [Ceratina calcarata]|uniref:Tryptophan--tRNA ligase, mitochondrial n=1 Tax=Ceratina calcarata TaxID=156304 RepID=A0AAJ7RWZ6_9HYME|nr:tryptophan--tRNA ligase, mitochondrial isoform X3 [Ceratina calcarata]
MNRSAFYRKCYTRVTCIGRSVTNYSSIVLSVALGDLVSIFSGIQPSGGLHLGNYLGAVQKWIELQNNGENIVWSIVDLHSITLPHDPKELNDNILKMTATLLACGIDPKKSILFQQSTIPLHTQLCWVLGCITTLPRLSRLPQFREKSQELKVIPLSLYIYPVLQAADILLYKATHIPVGQDQVQHIQLAQELAVKFNKRYGDTFPVPHSLVNEDASQRIKSLRDPTKKMSKSSQDEKSKIEILDEPDVIREKIKKAVTDCTSRVTYEPETRPGVSNLVIIHSMLTGKSPDEICPEVESLDTGKYKMVVAEIVIEKLTPLREEFLRLIREPIYLQEVLKTGTDKAMEIASDCWYEVQSKIGFEGDVFRQNEKHVQNISRKL